MIAFCIKEKKPYVLIDAEELTVERASGKIETFIDQYFISILNVAGPRASGESRTYEYARKVILRLFHGAY